MDLVPHYALVAPWHSFWKLGRQWAFAALSRIGCNVVSLWDNLTSIQLVQNAVDILCIFTLCKLCFNCPSLCDRDLS